MLRDNRLKRMMREGKAAFGTSPLFRDPDSVEFLGLLGYDFIFIDGEHGSVGLETVGSLVRAANVVGIEPVVRAPMNDPAVILGFMETGAYNIVVPHCNTAESVRHAVEAVKYPPLGVRGAGSGSRAANYGLTQTAAEYFAAANELTMVLPMIEEEEAVENIDSILAVEGLEAIFIGPGDLSLTMGYPGQPFHPAVRERVDLVVERARARGIWVGTVGRDVEGTRAMVAQGVGIVLGGAASLLAAACKSYLEGVRR